MALTFVVESFPPYIRFRKGWYHRRLPASTILGCGLLSLGPARDASCLLHIIATELVAVSKTVADDVVHWNGKEIRAAEEKVMLASTSCLLRNEL